MKGFDDYLQNNGFEPKDSRFTNEMKDIKSYALDNIDNAIETNDIGAGTATFMYISLQFLPQEEWEVALPADGKIIEPNPIVRGGDLPNVHGYLGHQKFYPVSSRFPNSPYTGHLLKDTVKYAPDVDVC